MSAAYHVQETKTEKKNNDIMLYSNKRTNEN